MMRLILFFTIFFWMIGNAFSAELRLAVTTSFQNSGLSDVLLPQIKKDTGLDVRLLVVGTGQALKLGRMGDVDAILVHSREAEESFVSKGYALHRREIMYNDYVLIGPDADAAKIGIASNASEALKRLFETKSPFVSRGDDSGTHRKELALWKSAGFEPSTFDPDWYRAAGSGMGATLNTASGMNAYVMSDRASWLKFANKGDLKLLYSGDPILFNQYTYLPIDPKRHSHINHDAAMKLEEWLTAAPAQAMIGNHTIGGEKLFRPNAK